MRPSAQDTAPPKEGRPHLKQSLSSFANDFLHQPFVYKNLPFCTTPHELIHKPIRSSNLLDWILFFNRPHASFLKGKKSTLYLFKNQVKTSHFYKFFSK